MKSIIVSALTAILIVGVISGCTSTQRRDAGTLGGAIAGGVAGSALTGGSTAGTIAGAVGGGYVGRQVSH